MEKTYELLCGERYQVVTEIPDSHTRVKRNQNKPDGLFVYSVRKNLCISLLGIHK